MMPAGRLRILVVDDYGDVGAMLCELLRGRGHDTRMANDGETALQIAEHFKPDVAFLDIGLPVIDGYELARRLKALPGLAAVRLIAITGHGQPADRQKAEAAGFSNHLIKPIDFDLLEKLLSDDA